MDLKSYIRDSKIRRKLKWNKHRLKMVQSPTILTIIYNEYLSKWYWILIHYVCGSPSCELSFISLPNETSLKYGLVCMVWNGIGSSIGRLWFLLTFLLFMGIRIGIRIRLWGGRDYVMVIWHMLFDALGKNQSSLLGWSREVK